jgi:hypothetical protein
MHPSVIKLLTQVLCLCSDQSTSFSLHCVAGEEKAAFKKRSGLKCQNLIWADVMEIHKKEKDNFLFLSLFLTLLLPY